MYVLAIHGGAGTIEPGSISSEKENQYHAGIAEALQAGGQILLDGGSARDAVERAVCSLEDNPLFNAGRGAVFTNEGKHELEAAIMCGRTLNAGAATGIRQIKNPITLARAVMEKSEYVFLCGQGAETFAREQHIAFVPEDYFFTEERYQEWKEKQKKEADKGKSKGTVGAVAIDEYGNLAAATSTGGLTNKKYGRVGDSPLIGCGTYANNSTCAVSCTGDGEYFIRTVAAYELYALMAYKEMPIQEACTLVIHQKLKAIEGEGGIIAVDRFGQVGFSYNSPNMHRGCIRSDGSLFTAVFEEERHTHTIRQ
jgi:beta-aspartyl-peptidase (threonine type)